MLNTLLLSIFLYNSPFLTKAESAEREHSFLQVAQINLSPELPKDARVTKAKRAIYDGYGRTKELTFEVATDDLGKNGGLFRNEARSFLLELGGNQAERNNANFKLTIYSSNRFGDRSLFHETFNLNIFGGETIIAAYSAEVSCGQSNQWTNYNGSRVYHCRLDKKQIREIFYRLADKVSGY